MLSCLSCVRSVFCVLGGLVELEPREYNCGLRYLTVSCSFLKKNHSNGSYQATEKSTKGILAR